MGIVFIIIKINLKTFKQRFLERREFALNRVDEVPLRIKAIARCNFHTSKIPPGSTNHRSHSQAELKTYLGVANLQKNADFFMSTHFSPSHRNQPK